MTPLVRCPVCEGPVLIDWFGSAVCVRSSGDHLRIIRAGQRVKAGETLHSIIHSTVDR